MNKNISDSYKYENQHLQQLKNQNYNYEQKQINNSSPLIHKSLPVILQNEAFQHDNINDTQQQDQNQKDIFPTSHQKLSAIKAESQNYRLQLKQQEITHLKSRQKSLLQQLKQKQREIQKIQQRYQMLKATNECLRQTIKQQQNRVYELQQKLQENASCVQNQVEGGGIDKDYCKQIQRPEDQKAILLGTQNLPEECSLDYFKQTQSLHRQIQSVKLTYENEIEHMLIRHDETCQDLLREISLLGSQKRELEQHNSNLTNELEELKRDKKTQLQSHLQVLQDMKRQIDTLKAQSSHLYTQSLLNSVHENLEQNFEDSYIYRQHRSFQQDPHRNHYVDPNQSLNFQIQRLISENINRQKLEAVVSKLKKDKMQNLIKKNKESYVRYSNQYQRETNRSASLKTKRKSYQYSRKVSLQNLFKQDKPFISHHPQGYRPLNGSQKVKVTVSHTIDRQIAQIKQILRKQLRYI